MCTSGTHIYTSGAQSSDSYMCTGGTESSNEYMCTSSTHICTSGTQSSHSYICTSGTESGDKNKCTSGTHIYISGAQSSHSYICTSGTESSDKNKCTSGTHIYVSGAQSSHSYMCTMALTQANKIRELVALIYIQVAPSAHTCDSFICTSGTQVDKYGTHMSISGTQSCHSHIYMWHPYVWMPHESTEFESRCVHWRPESSPMMSRAIKSHRLKKKNIAVRQVSRVKTSDFIHNCDRRHSYM